MKAKQASSAADPEVRAVPFPSSAFSPLCCVHTPVNAACHSCCNTPLSFFVPGHPLTKAFITHGGTNGLYEAIYHGIPMVGIPMFADQHDNLAHMVAKGAAVQVDFNTMKTQDLIDALKTVIYNST